MYSRVAQRLTLRTAISLTICIALLPTPGISLLISGAAQGQREERKGKAEAGKTRRCVARPGGGKARVAD